MSESSPSDIVVCEVTGKVLPASDTVVLDGKRVGAEGKAILLERRRSGESGDTALHPGFWRRFGAMFLDGLVFWVPSKVIEVAQKAGEASLTVQLVANLALAAAVVVYFTWMHASKGQTLGKMACGLKVVEDDLSPLTLGRSFVRTLWHKGGDILIVVVSIVALQVLPLQGAGYTMLGLAGLVLVYLLASIIMALVDSDKQRAIHDRAAGTRVVRVSGLRALGVEA